MGGPTLPNGLPYPDGDEIVDLLVPKDKVSKLRAEAETLPKALLTDIDVNWLQTVAEGWAAPLKGFMREGTLLQTMHFNSILVDPKNITGSKALNELPTNFLDFKTVPPKRVSMSVPIVLPCTVSDLAVYPPHNMQHNIHHNTPLTHLIKYFMQNIATNLIAHLII